MRSKWLLGAIGLLIAVLAIGAIACGDDEKTAEEIVDDILDELDDLGVLFLTASLTEVDGSGASGEANLSVNGEGILVSLAMQGLSEGAHANHLHDGGCDDLGEIHITLDNIVADDAGDGIQTTGTDEPPLSHFETGHALAVHAEDGAIVACGDVVSG
ncbi:MAG: hypothetical protein IIB87_00930 [Chloroflexi bacterium]|nr:hypothetical protein [Chloroflexota bacterium]